jgi:hypothetical protein
MEYPLPCACGDNVTVTEAAAGTTVTCSCGRAIDVPSWRELNALSGNSAPSLNPALAIETLLGAGKVPFDPICARCGTETAEQVQVIAECERVQIKGGGVSWPTLILSALFLPIFIFLVVAIFVRKRVEVHGQDKVYWLPLPACAQCRQHLKDAATLQRAFRNVKLYRQLLKKFPDARIRLTEP